MWPLRNNAGRHLGLCCLCLCAVPCCVARASAWASPREKSPKATPVPIVRWNEEQPGSTFSRGDDGKYRYGVWSGDVGVVLAVDARELQIIRHCIEPIFGVFLTIRYRGNGNLDASAEEITLQFVKHFKVVQTALDADDYTEKIQAD